MLFNLIIFVLFVAVAYFHYAEGLFSATLSAIICILAAVLAVGYHQTLEPLLMKIPEQATAVSLVVLFAAAYVILRQLFDRVVPGNVRFPLLMDKIGAGVMGIIAGLFSTGVLALAAQALPFGGDVGGYARQDLQDRPDVSIPSDAIPNSTRIVDSSVTGELVGDQLGDPNHLNHLWLHQDDLVLAVTRQLSDNGSALANGFPLEQSHPDYLTELFGQRIASPVGSKRTLINTATTPVVSIGGAFSLAKLPVSMDAEIPAVRGSQVLPDVPAPNADTVLLVVRIQFSSSTDAADTDGLLRLSPSAVRLKAGDKDFYPVGTLVGGALLLKNRADDPLLIDISKSQQTVDFVFVIADPDTYLKVGDGKDKSISFRPNSFVDIKRYALADLSGREISSDFQVLPIEADYATSGTLGGVLRKFSVGNNAMAKLGAAQQQQSASKQPSANSKNNQPGTPAAPGSKENDLLPETPGRLMGL